MPRNSHSKTPHSPASNGDQQRPRAKYRVLLVGARLFRDEPLRVRLGRDYVVTAVETATEAMVVIGEGVMDVLIVEEALRDRSGIDLLYRLRLRQPQSLRLLVVDDVGSKLSDHDVQEAAIYQVIVAPWQIEQVDVYVHAALASRERSHPDSLSSGSQPASPQALVTAQQSEQHRAAHVHTFDQLIFVSDAMIDVCRSARKAAFTDLPVVIEGERGTGAGQMACAIHHFSARNQLPLVIRQCSSLSDEQLQADLFGDRANANHAGISSDSLGTLVDADGATLFLDDIDAISLTLQHRLLAFLRDGEVRALGSEVAYRSDVRIIAASHRPLRQLVADGTFRQDLYYRLRGFELTMPPLRDRPEDIAPLIAHLCKEHMLPSQAVPAFTPDAMEKLTSYAFPGNVSELKNELRRLLTQHDAPATITVHDLSPAIVRGVPSDRRHDDPLAGLPGESLKEKVEALEARLVRATLDRCDWNHTKAAQELGLSRVGLANKIRRYKIRQRRSQ